MFVCSPTFHEYVLAYCEHLQNYICRLMICVLFITINIKHPCICRCSWIQITCVGSTEQIKSRKTKFAERIGSSSANSTPVTMPDANAQIAHPKASRQMATSLLAQLESTIALTRRKNGTWVLLKYVKLKGPLLLNSARLPSKRCWTTCKVSRAHSRVILHKI